MPGPREGQTRFTKTFTAGAADVPMAVDVEGAPRLPQKVVIWQPGTYVLHYEALPGGGYAYTDGPFAYAPANDGAMEIDAPVAAIGAGTTNGVLVKGIY
jgi:hypothetical protein